MRKTFILCLLLLSVICSFGQEDQPKGKKPKKEHKKKEKKEKKLPENIEAIQSVFSFRPKYVIPSTLFDITNKNGNGLRFNYVPFVWGVVGAGVKIKTVYVAYSMTLPTTTAMDRTYGVTHFYDIDLLIQTRITGIDLYYQDYKGFYLLNPAKYYPGWTSEDPYPQKSQLRTVNAGMNLTFLTNHNFSPAAAFSQSERQKTSRGSFIIGITERYSQISTDSSIVPKGQAANYPTLNKLKLGNYYSSILSVGFGYSIVKGKFNVTPMLLAGSGLLGEDYILTDGSNIQIRVPVYADAKLAIGYNGNHFFTNLILHAELNSLPLDETRMQVYHGAIEFGLGIRF